MSHRCVVPYHVADTNVSAQNELRMHYYLAQIVLLQEYLVYHSQSPVTNDPHHLERICKGRACVIAASNTILFTADRVERMQITNVTWLSAYTIFISTIVLLTAISFVEDTNLHKREAIERTIQIAIHVLRYKSYAASEGKNTYLEFLTVSQSQCNAN